MNTIHIKSSGKMHKGDWLRIFIMWMIVMILRYGVFSMLLLVFPENCLSQKNHMNSSAFMVGEVLRYKVKWSFIRLGTMEVRQESSDSVDKTRYRITLTAESALGLPFIDVYFVNRGIVSTETLASFEFVSEVGRDKKNTFVHRIDTIAKKLVLTEFLYNLLTNSDTLDLKELIYDDPGLFMLFRCFAGSGETKQVSSVMESRLETTTFTFPAEREQVEVAAFHQPVEAFRFEGKASWTRPEYAGLKGEFCGWVSADSAAVPLRIEAKIFLGSIVLELEGYERAGWHVRDTILTELRK